MAGPDSLSPSVLDKSDREAARSRGKAIEKKIEVLESMAANVSNRRSRRWLNDRLLIELVPRLNFEEIRGLFAPPPWGDDIRLSAFCGANSDQWDILRNSDMDSESRYIQRVENLSANGKHLINKDKLIALQCWHRLDCQTREVLKRSVLSDLLISYEDQVRAFIGNGGTSEVLVMHVQDPFHRLLLHGVCEFYNLSSITIDALSDVELQKATTIKRRPSTSDTIPSITLGRENRPPACLPSRFAPPMASLPCAFYLLRASAAPPRKLRSPFAASSRRLGWLRRASSVLGAPSPGGGGATCWFRFGNAGVDAEGAGIYGSQRRDDFDRDDVEQYFNYMGMLAVEGSYDKMEALLNQNIHPVDILLMLAACEGDKPKIEELLRAGANYEIRDVDGRTALDRANEEIKDFILGYSAKKA